MIPQVMAIRYKTILLFGSTGSGKGTQGKILGVLPGFRHCACGDVFRSLDPQSPMGRLFAQYSKSGSLVPDEFTVDLWRQTIDTKAAAGQIDPEADTILLDGIPRTVEQARLLADRIDVRAVINLYCNDVEQIVARLQKRAAKENRADDTNIDVIRHRIDVYDEQTRPILEYYPGGKIFRVNATQEPEKVTADILQALSVLKR